MTTGKAKPPMTHLKVVTFMLVPKNQQVHPLIISNTLVFLGIYHEDVKQPMCD